MHDDEIALSYLNGKELQKQVGDPISLVINGQKQEMAVSGIYQDLTNGGRTAKAVLPADADAALRYEIMLDLKPGVDIREKVAAYASRFPQAKVTDVEGYLGQTFASTIEQVRIFTFLTIGVSFLVAMLITALFIKMLIAKDDTQIAIMKRIGFSSGAIRLQHVCRSLFVLVIGMSLGTILANTLGQLLVSSIMSMAGAPKINFVVDPVQAFILWPLIFFSVVLVTTLMCTTSIKKSGTIGRNVS